MPVRLRCQCGQSLTVPEQKAGLRVLCPVCKEYLTIPAAPAGATELVTAATTKVQAEIVAAISGERKTAVKTASGERPQPAQKSSSKKSAQPNSNAANERPLPSPPAKAPTPAAQRPRPRVAAPRAAPQPPPRKSRPSSTTPHAEPAAPTARDETIVAPPAALPNPPMRPVAAKPAPTPPPLPRAKNASIEPPPVPVQKPTTVGTVVAPPPAKAPSPAPAALPQKMEASGIALAIDAGNIVRRETQNSSIAADETQVVRGVEHDPAKRLTVYLLGFGMAVLALGSAYPAAMEIVRHLRDPLSLGMENWTYLLLLVSGIQIVYALYLVQLPDWSSVWVTMIVTSLVAVLYAVGLGMSLMATPDNEVIAVLGLTQLHAGGHLSLWCFLLTMLTALLSYSMVRTSVKWHKLFTLAMAHGEQ